MMNLFNQLLQSSLWDPSTLLGALVYFVVFSVLAILAARGTRLLFDQTVKRDTRGLIDKTVGSFLVQLLQLIIYIVALTLYAQLVPSLRALGTALLAGVSISAVVIGLAAQNTLGNFVAGIALLLYRPFRVGDRLQVNAPSGLETGTVESVTLGYTILQTFDNRHIVVPNSAIANQVTVNLTRMDPRIMALIPIGIGYDADIEQARAIILQLARSHSLVEEVAGCPVIQLGDSSVTLSLRVWCANPQDAKQVEFDLYEQVKTRFDGEGIEIPFPYTNVILKQTPATGNGV